MVGVTNIAINLFIYFMFFEKGAFTVLIQIGDKQVPAVEKTLVALTPKAKNSGLLVILVAIMEVGLSIVF